MADFENKPTILCVDDTPTNLMLLNEYLSPLYKMKLINNGKDALSLLEREKVDLILLDVMMPEMDGYEVCRRIRNITQFQHLPVLFITAKNSSEDEEMALSVGGNDFISKPINPKVLKARVNAHLKAKIYHDLLENENQRLEQELQNRLSDIFKLQDATLAVMISLAEFRDECTGNHIKRTQSYITALAKKLLNTCPEFNLTEHKIGLINKCSPLHDIGKITIPDHILLKPGKLTDEEFEIMKTHAQRGVDILNRASSSMGYYGEFLQMASEIALTHHEKWDGSGYPQALSGEAIPLSGRMMAIVDVYDALRSERPYKKAFNHEEALGIMKEGVGRHFDPKLFENFMEIEKEIFAISEALRD
jgi:putative two-component system response regulator